MTDENATGFDSIYAELVEDDADFVHYFAESEERTAARDWLRSHRESLQLRQVDIKERLGVSQSVISDFESVQTNPSVGRMQEYARALEIKLRLVFTQLDSFGTERILWSASEDLCPQPHQNRAVIHIESGFQMDDSGLTPVDGQRLISTDAKSGQWKTGATGSTQVVRSLIVNGELIS